MPRLGKRTKHLRWARGVAKKARVSTAANNCASETSDSAAGPRREPQEVSDSSDDDFDVDEALKVDPDALIEEFTADWVASLCRDDLYSLSLLLLQILTQDFQLKITAALNLLASTLSAHTKLLRSGG